jgi:hypothetical protein
MTSPVSRDEVRLVAALTEVLREKRRAIVESDAGARMPAWLAPIWQPLLDELEHFRIERQSGKALPPSPELAAQAAALQLEYEGLQHTLTVWSAALQQAIAAAGRQHAAPVYGSFFGGAGAPRQTLGRG